MSAMMAPMQEIPRISTVSLGLPSVAMDRSKELPSHTYLFAGGEVEIKVSLYLCNTAYGLGLWNLGICKSVGAHKQC